MRNLPLHSYPQPADKPAVFPDHTVFTGLVANISTDEHISSSALICVLDGMLSVKLNRVTHKLSQGAFLIVSRGSAVALHASKPCSPFVLCFGDDVQVDSGWNIAERVHIGSGAFNKRVTELAGLGETCSSFVALRAEAILRSIIADITEFSAQSREASLRLALKKVNGREENYKRVATVRDWMTDNFAGEVSLKQLASSAALDPQHFLRLFAQLYAITPRQFIIERRIEEAKRLLLNTNMTIEGVCYQLGWQSVPTFTHVFRQKTGATPSQFRKITREAPKPLSHS